MPSRFLRLLVLRTSMRRSVHNNLYTIDVGHALAKIDSTSRNLGAWKEVSVDAGALGNLWDGGHGGDVRHGAFTGSGSSIAWRGLPLPGVRRGVRHPLRNTSYIFWLR